MVRIFLFNLWNVVSYVILLENIKHKIMKKFVTLIAILTTTMVGFGQENLGEVIGTVLEKGTERGVFGAHIYILDNGKKYNAHTDVDGRFRVSGIPAGNYMINIKHLGDTMSNIFAEVPMDGFYQMGTIEFDSEIFTLDETFAIYNRNEIRMVDGNLPVNTLNSEEIEKSAVKTDLTALINSMSSDVRMTNDGELVFRGARKGDMLFLVDGVKTTEIGSAPSASIGRIMMYTGGLPAKYGDTLGGVVVMETKSYFDLYRRWENSQRRAGKIK